MPEEITPEQLEKYRKFWREHDASVKKQVVDRYDRAWVLARQAAQILKEEFGVSRVVVFGSLIHPELFHSRSDIDLGVWNVIHYFQAVARLMDLDPHFDFDLVPVEDARAGVLAVIEQEGVEI